MLGLCVWFATSAGALTFEYADGTSITGDIVQGKPEFLQVRTADNKYEKVEWSKLSQATLTELQKDPKYAPFVQPYIEVSQEEIIKKTEVVLKPVPRLERPAKGSLIGAMFKSSVGIVCLLLLYAANIYAGYEVASVRAYPPAMVCGISAVVPVIGPIIFLCMPTKLPSRDDEVAEPEAAPAAAPGSHSATYTAEPAGHGAAAPGHTTAESGHAASGALPQTQVFKRGQFTFNRRFIETKFSAFFGAIRRGDEKDLVLVVKSVRGEYVATRISRIASNDMHLDVHKGGASQEVQMPFVEIQEIQLKHKDA
ncbi:MAG: hypothetical protein AAB370_05935 [Verrucomicrobiota bacterium]